MQIIITKDKIALFWGGRGLRVCHSLKLQQTPETPCPPKKRNRPNGQQKSGKVSIFSLF